MTIDELKEAIAQHGYQLSPFVSPWPGSICVMPRLSDEMFKPDKQVMITRIADEHELPDLTKDELEKRMRERCHL